MGGEACEVVRAVPVQDTMRYARLRLNRSPPATNATPLGGALLSQLLGSAGP